MVEKNRILVRLRMLFISIILLSACGGGLQDQADAALSNGSYALAQKLYGDILRDDPSNASARAGLNKTYEMSVARKLRDIRTYRENDKWSEALGVLLQLTGEETQLGFSPEGEYAVAQEDETRKALAFIKAYADKYVGLKLPLVPYSLIEPCAPIFRTGSLSEQFQQIRTVVVVSGKESCERFSRNVNARVPYYADFVSRYCSVWGVGGKGGSLSLPKSYLQVLYRGLETSIKVSGMPDAALPIFQRDLEQAFRATPWFDQQGKLTLPVAIGGSFARAVSQFREARLFEYTIKEPYTEFVPQLQSRQVPYTAYENQCAQNYSTGQMACGMVTVTKYRLEMYTENVPTTSYRSIPKSQPYEAIRIQQALTLSLGGTARLAPTTVEFQTSDRADGSDYEHNVSMPSIGLTPKRAQLTDPLEWLKGESAATAKLFQQKVSESWKAKFCTGGAKKTTADLGDAVHRCMRVALSPVPAFVDQWYIANIGMTYSGSKDLLKR